MNNDDNNEQFISDLYQATAKSEASEKTDEQILQYARHRVASGSQPKAFLSPRNRWLSVAASVTLVSVLFVSQWQHFTPESLQESPEASIAEVAHIAPSATTQDEVTSLTAKSERTTPESRTSDALQSEDEFKFADKAIPVESAARTAINPKATEQIHVTASRFKESQSGIKAECRYSVDGAKPLSTSPIAKYIAELTYQDKGTLATAINNQLPLQQLTEQHQSLSKITRAPGFSEQYQQMSQQVKSCVAATGPATE